MTIDNLQRLAKFSANNGGMCPKDAWMKKHYLGGSYEDPMNPANDWVNGRGERIDVLEPQPE